MLARLFVIAVLVACSARSQRPRASDAVLTTTPTPTAAPAKLAWPPSAWIRFMPQSTYFCVRLPDGQLRSTAYGVGGNTPTYSLAEGVELGHAERDALCTNYGITVLGVRGQIGYTHQYHEKEQYTVEHIEPGARSLGVINLSRCWVDGAGKLDCLANTGRRPTVYIDLLNGDGAIDHLIPTAPCAVYRDGHVACVTENGQPALVPLFTNVRNASIVSHGWSQFAGCAVLRTGKVACLGNNALALRSFTDTTRALTPVEIPGLENVDEVTVGGATACARRGGEVWCWGEAAWSQAGAAALTASQPMPRCVVDDAATKQAQAAFDAAKKQCADPNRPRNRRGDDPLCRGMSGAIPPGLVFKHSDTPCDRSQGASSSRWARPTKVEGITGALAIATNGRLTCALRGERMMTCWGNEVDEPKSITFPARTLVAEPPASNINVATRRGLSLQVGEKEIIVSSASGMFTRHAFANGVPAAGEPMPGVIDAIVDPHCTLVASGEVTCEKLPAGLRDPEFPKDASTVRISYDGLGCVVSAAGLLRCGTDGAQMAAVLGLGGPIVEHAGVFARYANGSVGMLARDNMGVKYTAPVVRWSAVKAWAANSWTGCAVLHDGAVSCVDEAQQVTTVAGLPAASAVALNYSHRCAIGVDGTAWCWETAKRPAQVAGISDAIAIDVSNEHACVITSKRELACWKLTSPRVRRVKTTID
jgi:hypothetical protein